MRQSGAEGTPPPSDPGEEQRYRSALALDAGAPAGREALLEALSDASWRVRAAAVERLAEGDASLAPVLVEALGAAGGAGRRNAAAEALVRLGPAAVPALVGALGAPSGEVRTAAAEVLGRIQDRGALDPLAARLADPDPNVRAAAAAALGEIGAPGAARALVEALERDDPPLRQAALESLARLGVAPPLDRLEALASDRGLRRSALRLLGLRDEAGAEELLARALADRSRAVREAALAGLWLQRRRRPPEALAGLAAAVRAAAARSPEVAAGCAEALGLEDRDAAGGALCALAWLARPELAGAVAGAADDERLRSAAVEALEALGPALRDAVAPVLPGLPPGGRAAVLLALARAGDPSLLPLLAGDLACDDEPVRSAAIEAAGRLGDPRVLPALRALLDHPDGTVSAAAAGALTQVAARSEQGRTAVLAACRQGPGPGPAVLRLLGRLGEEGVRPRPRAAAWDSGPRMSAGEFRLLRDMIQERFGLFFRDDAKFLLERRLAPRLEAHGLAGFGDYYRLLRHDPGRRAELDTAVELLTTNETYFYREPHQLRAFDEEILPLLARAGEGRRRLRVWSAGCSTGEEPYTIAILLLRSGLFRQWDVEVLGTDLSRRVLEAARRGVYGPSAFRAPESEQLRPWFRPQEGRWAVRDEVAGMVRFEHLNLLDPGAAAGTGTADVVFCRNVLIYFDLPARRRVLAGFRRRLRPGGFLLLGHSESLLQITADFELVHLRNDLVYRRPEEEASP